MVYFLPLLAAAFLLALLSVPWKKRALLLASVAFAASFGLAGFASLAVMAMLVWSAVRSMFRVPVAQRRVIAGVATVLLLLPLVVFKNYFGASSLLPALLRGSGAAASPGFSFAPVGLSFFTFRALGLLFDTAQRRIERAPSFRDTINFLFFFPQLLSGPIERAGRFLPQLDVDTAPEYRRIVDGMILIAVGVFMKGVIADRLSIHVDAVFAHPAAATRSDALLAFYFSAIQIYCDFSGYTNIALGLCAVLGFDAAVNFRQPYMASSISDFWNRWHMSLSFWLRDFLFLPLAYAGDRRLAGRLPARKTRERAVYTLCALVTMTVCGVWHGAAPTFVVWGLLFGIYLALGRVSKPLRARMWRVTGLAPGHPLRRVAAIAVTFHLVSFSWVLFRAASIGDSWIFFSTLVGPSTRALASISPMTQADVMLSLLLCAAVYAVQYFQEQGQLLAALASRRPALRWAVYTLLIVGIEMLTVTQGPVRFAYAAF